MPELPDITIYREALDARIRGRVLLHIRIINPFLLRTAVPPVSDVEGRRVIDVRRLGKRIVLALEDDYFLVAAPDDRRPVALAGRQGQGAGAHFLATFEFDNGTLAFTEAGTRRRASLHCVRGEAAVAAFDLGGLDVLDADNTAFSSRLRSENHTLKRALTDPRLFSGIGNAYSDEILHRARLSPLTLTSRLDDAECACLLRRRTERSGGMDRSPARRSGRCLPGKGHRLSAGDGRPRQIRPALPGLRRAGAAHRLRRKRMQLLRTLPERRRHPRRSRTVAAPAQELAAVDRRARPSRTGLSRCGRTC